MIKRLLAILAAVGIAFAVPLAAQATPYPAPEATLTCSTTQATPGGTFTCTVTGTDGDVVELQITFPGQGTVTLGPQTIVDGETTFTITAPDVEGTIGITAVVNDVAIATAAVEVAEELSGTGFDSMPLAVGAGVLLIAGAAVVLIGARRRSAHNS